MSNSITPSNGGNKRHMCRTIQDVMSENWQMNPSRPRKRGGVYRIVERATGELLYIGQASDLSSRLTPSVHPVYRKSKHDVYIVFEQDKNERCKMEYRFITIMKPKLNKRNGWIPEYSETEMQEIYRSIFG
jgi:hypothetical protein